MTSFILRIPTLADLDTFRHQLPEKTYCSLFEKHSGTFHLKDTCVTLWKDGLGFRPVLQTEATKTLCSIQDGTSLPLPCPEVSGLIYLPGAQTVCWTKCGNLLIASRNVTDSISYDQLEALGLLCGISVKADFDQAVSVMLYRMLMTQPDSPQKTISEIMYDMMLGLKEADAPALLTESQMYTLAKRICAWSNESIISCKQLTAELVDVCVNGMPKELFNDYDTGSWESLSPEMCIRILCAGDKACFRALLGLKLRKQVIFDAFYEDLSHDAVRNAIASLSKSLEGYGFMGN